MRQDLPQALCQDVHAVMLLTSEAECLDVFKMLGWKTVIRPNPASALPQCCTPSCPYLGLNNTPICAVNDDDLYRPWSVGQLSHLEKEENSLAKYSVPSTAALLSPGRGLSPTPGSLRIPKRPQSGELLFETPC